MPFIVIFGTVSSVCPRPGQSAAELVLRVNDMVAEGSTVMHRFVAIDSGTRSRVFAVCQNVQVQQSGRVESRVKC